MDRQHYRLQVCFADNSIKSHYYKVFVKEELAPPAPAGVSDVGGVPRLGVPAAGAGLGGVLHRVARHREQARAVAQANLPRLHR